MVKNKIKVSIVVPIYGVEKYIRQSLDAMAAQTLPDMEFILVDDGSPDKCPEICDEYAARDNRFRVIHQKNGGMGNAYNNGIAAATGEYIGMAEPDDWMEPNMYELLYNNAKKYDSDLVKCSFYSYNSFETPADKEHYKLDEFAPENEVFSIFDQPKLLIFHSSVWATLYRSEIIKTIKFSETRDASYQDFPFMMEALVKSKRISVIHNRLVHYRQEPGNMSSVTRTDARCMLMAKQAEIARDMLIKYDALDKLQEEFYYHAFFANWVMFDRIEEKYKPEFFDILHKFFVPLKDNKSFTYKHFDLLCRNAIEAVIDGNYKKALQLTRYTKRYKIFGVPVIKVKYRFPITTIYVLGVCVARIKESKSHKKFFLLGIKIWSKRK